MKTSRTILYTVGAACLMLNASAASLTEVELRPVAGHGLNFFQSDSSSNLAAIPEPSVAVAIAGGLAILAGWRRLRE